MLDRWTTGWLKGGLECGAKWLNKRGVSADQVTLAGFLVGMLAIPALAMGWYLTALALILINRIADGLDGALARIKVTTDAGGFLDIVLDFIFYSGVVVGFGLADPAVNGLPAAVLIFSFVGTGASFLAYAIMAERRGLVNITYPHKGFYYLGGLAEGTETILFFVAICLFPAAFPVMAWCFAVLCFLTTATRVWGGYKTLSESEGYGEE
ncbi:CDP-alcohol phosphatidyltransferase family protein [Desulfosediminicola sp.]|uniref:CDP-alcohol phosphatidyltransferase family protein n=1 Tax=Desulfosediminicola sp. TaxID=2886825 RepID=UPI003AF2221E